VVDGGIVECVDGEALVGGIVDDDAAVVGVDPADVVTVAVDEGVELFADVVTDCGDGSPHVVTRSAATTSATPPPTGRIRR
jgi:hypothetical protein